MDNKEYFDLKFGNIENKFTDFDKKIDKIDVKISKLFDKSDLHHEQLLLHNRDISDLKEINKINENKNEKKRDKGWRFVLDITSKVAVAIILFILSYLQFKGG